MFICSSVRRKHASPALAFGSCLGAKLNFNLKQTAGDPLDDDPITNNTSPISKIKKLVPRVNPMRDQHGFDNPMFAFS